MHEVSIESSGRTVCTSSDPEVNSHISAALGGELELVRYPRFAESRAKSGRTLHLITTASLGRLRDAHPGGDFQARRFRPNIVVDTGRDLDGFPEDGWVGSELEMGPLRVRVEKPNVRCKVTTMRQPGIEEDQLILETIQKVHGSNLGVMCTAIGEGVLRVGDPVGRALGAEPSKLF